MEKVFSALGHPLRLWIVLQLSENGPSRQAAILAALNEAGIAGRKLNPGEMTQHLRPLFEAGLITRTPARGPIRLSQPDQIGRLLATASALAVATTEGAAEDAQRSHAQLRRGSLKPSRAAPGLDRP